MLFDKKWRAARKLRKEEKKDDLEKDEKRLKALKLQLDPTSDDYKKIVEALNQNNKIRKESIESKRRVPIGDKVQIALKVLGITGLVVGAGKVIKAESDGMIFTGEKKGLMDSIIKFLGGLLKT